MRKLCPGNFLRVTTKADLCDTGGTNMHVMLALY